VYLPAAFGEFSPQLAILSRQTTHRRAYRTLREAAVFAGLHKLPTIRLHYNQLLLLLLLAGLQMPAVGLLCLRCCWAAVTTDETAILATPAVRVPPKRWLTGCLKNKWHTTLCFPPEQPLLYLPMVMLCLAIELPSKRLIEFRNRMCWNLSTDSYNKDPQTNNVVAVLRFCLCWVSKSISETTFLTQVVI